MIAKNKPAKPWYLRKRLWIGVAAVVTAVVTALVPVLGPIASAAILGGVGAAVAVLSAVDNGTK